MKTKLAKLAITAALLAAMSATAETDVIEVPTGAEVRCPYAAKVVGARVHSSVASGTATIPADWYWLDEGQADVEVPAWHWSVRKRTRPGLWLRLLWQNDGMFHGCISPFDPCCDKFTS